MRRIIFLVPVLLCAIVKGQNEQTFINTRWHSTSQVNELENHSTIHTTNLNGSSLNVFNFTGDDGFLHQLEYINGAGEILWQTSPNDNELGQCTHSILLENGSSLIAGNQPHPEDFNVLKASVRHLNHLGFETWVDIDLEDTNSISSTSSIRLSADSSIWHSSISWSFENGPTSRLRKLSLEGEVLWTMSQPGLIADIQVFGSQARIFKWQLGEGVWTSSLLKISASGEILSQALLDQSFETPDALCAIEKDLNGNLIVVCEKTTLGHTSIVVWSLSDSFQLNWTNTYSVPGTNLRPQAVAVDDSGNIFVGGRSQTDDAPENMLLCSIAANGTLNSLFNRPHANGLNQGIVNLVNLGQQQIAHLVSDDGSCHLIGLNGNKITWSRNLGTNILFESLALSRVDGRILHTWTNTSGIREREALSFHTITNTPSAQGDFIDNQLVVKFDPSFVDLTFIENKEKRFGRLQQVVGQALVDQLSAATGVDLDQKCTAIKIFPGLTPSIPNSISRTGNEVKTPDFWTCFRLVFSTEIDETELSQLLENGSSAIHYCEVNPIIHQMNEPNDPLYEVQTSLGTTGEISDNEEVKGMNLDGAWEYYTGSSDIKVGIFDDVIYWGHEDFGDGSLSGSIVKGGHDFVNDQELALANTPLGSHGTAVAGIIGAKRNNEIGISGIAGGDSEEGEAGVSLYSMGIFSGSNFVSEMSTATQAIVEASFENPETEYGYGLHIQNHSWGGFADSQLLREAVTYAWRNSSVFVAARGNAGNELAVYPACYEDERVISVGACDELGVRQENIEGNADSSYGLGMDILGPGSKEHTWSTIYSNAIFGPEYETSADNQYSSFNNTSSSAAHVSGVSALAYHACMQNEIAPIIPYTEDIENMIQLSGRDVNNELTAQYNDDNGWGWLDAHYLISSLSDPTGFIHHFEFDELNLANTTIESTIVLEESFESLDTGIYEGELLEFNATETFTIPESFELTSHWAAYSACLGLNNTQSYSGDHFSSDFDVVLQGTELTIVCTTHAFHILNDEAGNSIDVWLPSAPSLLTGAYSGYFRNIDPTYIETKIKTSSLIAFPMPCNSQTIITWEAADISSLSLYDYLGNKLQNQRIDPGSTSFILDVQALAPGPYLVQISGPTTENTTTIIKIP